MPLLHGFFSMNTTNLQTIRQLLLTHDPANQQLAWLLAESNGIDTQDIDKELRDFLDSVEIQPHIRAVLLDLPTLVQHLRRVYSLSLEHSNATECPSVLAFFPNLRVLELAHSNMTALGDDWQTMPHLTSLSIVDVPIQDLPMSLAFAQNLKYLTIKQTCIKQTPNVLQRLTKLEALSLAENPHWLPDDGEWLRGLPNLKRLVLDSPTMFAWTFEPTFAVEIVETEC